MNDKSNKSPLELIGERVQAKRNELNLTQEQFAEKYGYPRTTLAKLEAGLRDFKSTELLTLAEQLGVSCDYLLGRKMIKAPDNITQAANERYGLSEEALKNLCDITARTAPNKLPGFIETTSGNISASAVLSAVNAILTNELGLAMLQAFDYAMREVTTTNAVKEVMADTEDRNTRKQQEYAELLQFKAWRAFSKAMESISRPKKGGG